MNFTDSQIDSWCHQHFEEHLALLKRLAVIPAPSHMEDQRAAFILDWLRQKGAEHIWIDEAKNVVLSFCPHRDDALQVYMAHTDVVFPDTSPLPLQELNGKLCAPGIGDDTANVAALMLMAQFLLEQKRTYPLLFVFNSCEEGLGNLKGVRQIVRDYGDRIRELVSFDCGFDWLVEKAVGSHRYEVRAVTPGGHSFGNFGNPNAIACLAELITHLYRQPMPQRNGCTTTYNVGTIQGGTSVNTIAQDAVMTYEYRSDDRYCLSIMEKQFRETVAQCSAGNVTFEIRELGVRPCSADVPQDLHNALLRRCERAIHSVTGQLPRRCSASTDANIPLSMGIPAATFGLYRGGGAHTRQEYVETDSLTPGLILGLRFLLSGLEL